MKNKFIDDQFDHLESDIEKIRVRHRQYISYSNEAGAKSVVMEILNNSLDECRSPRSPGNKIRVHFDENTGIITVSDNGRGISTSEVEKIFTHLNYGSNIKTANKASLKSETLGQNGTGSLAICGLAEHVCITSYRGQNEGKSIILRFREGVKESEEIRKCEPKSNGMKIEYKPSKVMGRSTKIVWEDIRSELLNLQYLNAMKIDISSVYINKKNEEIRERYIKQPFEMILERNGKENIISKKINIHIEDDNIIEELDGANVKRFLTMDTAFSYTNVMNPYIDSFSNSNNTVDNGDHLDGAIEALCRYFQTVTKNSMSDKEKNSLDIKWDDVKTGLSVAVSLKTNYESLYTGQTKHKIVSKEIKKIVQDKTLEMLAKYFSENQSQLKEFIMLIKVNARARREGDRIKVATVKNHVNNWTSFKMKNYDPCTNKGIKEYKELYIIEGDSAKGSLKLSRNTETQALFAVRGVSANVFKLTLDKIVGPNGNKEFTDLITVMGCNVGPKFDISKLQFNKIIIASDADVDGLFIRSLLMAFFFKLFPEIIQDGRLFIAEPPLYRVDDKKNPFVINKEDYIERYVDNVIKHYKVGYAINDSPDYMKNKGTKSFLSETSSYVDELKTLSDHYKVNDRLIEFIIEELAKVDANLVGIRESIRRINIQNLVNSINREFKEIYYDDKTQLIRGVIDGKYQSIEVSESLVRKLLPLSDIVKVWGSNNSRDVVLTHIKTSTDYKLSLLGVLKILKNYQPNIIHRFKGLGENDDADIKTTIMDPNTRTLIKVHISDIENDMKIFQTLRGTSQLDAQNRKQMMRDYKISKESIDT